MKSITRLSLVLMIFYLLSVSYLVTSVSAQNTDCTQQASAHDREQCEKNNAAPGSAAAGHMNSGGNDCMNHPAGSAARTSCEKRNP